MTEAQAKQVSSLTVGDIAILNEIAQGRSATAAADRLGISYQIISERLTAIRLKLHVESTAAAVGYIEQY